MSDRTLRTLAALGSVALVAQGVTELMHTQGDPLKSATDYGIEAAFAVGVLGTLAGLVAFHRRIEASVSRFGNYAMRAAAGGQGLLGLVATGTLVRGHDVLGPLFPLAVAAWPARSIRQEYL